MAWLAFRFRTDTDPELSKVGWSPCSGYGILKCDSVYCMLVSFICGRAEKFLSVFEMERCKMIEMSCETHDKYAANSQFITHLMGRILGQQGLESTPIDTRGESPRKDDDSPYTVLPAHNYGIGHFDCSHVGFPLTGFQSVLKLVDNTCKDSFDLFYGLFKYNKHSADQILKLREAFANVERQLAAKEAYLLARAEVRHFMRSYIISVVDLVD